MSFDINSFNLAYHPVLGEGVWSRVYDLSDGTVIKLVKAESGGMTTGRDKFFREIEALSSLSSRDDLRTLVPHILAHGEIASDMRAGKDGHALWVRMTKKEGRSIDQETIAAMDEKGREALGGNLGRHIARLHQALAEAAIPPIVWTGGPFDELKEAAVNRPDLLHSIGILEQEYHRIFDSFDAIPCHNDCNLSNILFADGAISGVLDFAECNHNFPEKDISDIVKTCPCLEDQIVQAYERESGRLLDRRRIVFGLAENALYGVVIMAQKGDEAASRSYQRKLAQHMATLGYAPSSQSTINCVP